VERGPSPDPGRPKGGAAGKGGKGTRREFCAALPLTCQVFAVRLRALLAAVTVRFHVLPLPSRWISRGLMVGARRARQRDGFGLKFSGSSELNRSERGFKKGVQDRLGASIWMPR